MPNVVVAENHLTYGGIKYFRGNAEEAEIGSMGVKRTPVFGQNYLEVKDQIPVKKIKVFKSTIVEIDFNKTSKSSFNRNGSVIIKGIPVKESGSVVFERLKSGLLKLVKFSISNNDMKKAANNSPKKIRDLINWGNNARIVNQVFIVMAAKVANRFDNNITGNISVGVQGIEASVGGSSSTSGTTTVSISKGSCFAYLLLEPVWDAKQKKNKTEIIDFNDDQWGIN